MWLVCRGRGTEGGGERATRRITHTHRMVYDPTESEADAARGTIRNCGEAVMALRERTHAATHRHQLIGTTHTRMVSGSVSTMARAAARRAIERVVEEPTVCAAHGKAARVVDEAVTALRLQAEKKRSAAKEESTGQEAERSG